MNSVVASVSGDTPIISNKLDAASGLIYAVVEFFVEYLVASGGHQVRPWLPM